MRHGAVSRTGEDPVLGDMQDRVALRGQPRTAITPVAAVEVDVAAFSEIVQQRLYGGGVGMGECFGESASI